jgi:hypothetical protein
MRAKECPDFHSYNMKELKLIAHRVPYDNNLSNTKFPRDISKTNKGLKLNPIPLTLSKTRMIKVLNSRWETLVECRQKYYLGIDNPENYEENCPICYDSMTYKQWREFESNWIMEYNSGTIKTKCNHKFCSKCWDKLPLDNWQRIKCPLCRFNVHPYDDVQIKYA